jgi:hypothetical protein
MAMVMGFGPGRRRDAVRPAAGVAAFRHCHDMIFDRFRNRDPGMDSTGALAAVLTDADGVFGVPAFILDGDMFRGGDHLPDMFGILATEPI